MDLDLPFDPMLDAGLGDLPAPDQPPQCPTPPGDDAMQTPGPANEDALAGDGAAGQADGTEVAGAAAQACRPLYTRPVICPEF